MDQGGVSWLLLDVGEKAVKQESRRRYFPLQKNQKQNTYK